MQPVNYYSHESLNYALQGVDMVISTITGPEQLNLILAAGDGHVRHFVPGEFEGSLSHRPANDALDRGSAQALDLLRHLDDRRRMKYTVFSCGVFMETFLPYGLGTLGIGYGSGMAGAGDYIIDMNAGTAEYAERDSKRNHIKLCLTSVHDVVRFVVAALDLGPRHWPHELTMRGDRLSVKDLVTTCSMVGNGKTAPHDRGIQTHDEANSGLVTFNSQVLHYPDLALYHSHYVRIEDYERAAYYQRLLATADGRYDFSRASLNEIVANSPVVNVQPLTFAQWMTSQWRPSP